MIEINKYNKYPVDDDFFKELRTNYYGNKYEKLPDQDRINDSFSRNESGKNPNISSGQSVRGSSR